MKDFQGVFIFTLWIKVILAFSVCIIMRDSPLQKPD